MSAPSGTAERLEALDAPRDTSEPPSPAGDLALEAQFAARLGPLPRHSEPAGRWRPIGHYTRTGEAAKETLDRVLAAIGLMLVSPVLLAIAIAVRLDSPGPAFFRQTRIGRGGRPFTFWKFRGMYVDARERFPELYDYRYSGEQVRELRFHPPADPRVTRVGRFIRRTSLDELPNLVNVVRGDMSLVGPRPEIPELMPYYGPAARVVLSVRPGITSLAKLLGRDHYSFRETLELDVRYVRARSLRLDLGVLLGTVWMVLTGRNVGS
ncbi:MAG TPA: sugar transferase [Candidatus Acidoferrales bacterium]|nr:sugar transferase [Candidatus Acidoferrales bacterium]